jgi:hypothetical protein
MSDTAADTAAVIPASTILPAKSEDKLEIEKEEQEEAAKSDQEAAAENKDTEPAAAENDETAAAVAGDEEAETAEKKEEEAGGGEGEDTEKKAEKKKFSLPKVKPPKVLTELRAKSKERKKVIIRISPLFYNCYFFLLSVLTLSRVFLSEFILFTLSFKAYPCIFSLLTLFSELFLRQLSQPFCYSTKQACLYESLILISFRNYAFKLFILGHLFATLLFKIVFLF